MADTQELECSAAFSTSSCDSMLCPQNICQRAGEPGDNVDIMDPQNNNVNDEHIPPLISEYASKRIGQDFRSALLRDFALRNTE
jgi:hypothetical protein